MASKEKESRVGGWREPIITIDNKAFVLIIEGDYLTKCSKAGYVCVYWYSLIRKNQVLSILRIAENATFESVILESVRVDRHPQ